MYLQTMKSVVQKISAVFVSLLMITSLSFPLSAFAEDTSEPAATPNPQTSAPSETSDQSQPVGSTLVSPDNPTNNQAPASPQQESQGSSNSSAANSPAAPQAQTSTNVDSTAPKTQTTAETDAALSNVIDSDATSGDASAHQNTTVGNVTTGNAAALATIVNLLQSNVNFNGSQPITFVHDITGTVSGDLLVDPAVIAALGTNAPLFGDTAANSTIDTSTQATITNAININAASGNANATQNTTAGNVQSGNANAVANVVNLINSSVAAGQSFIGMINIYGSLQGNILVPEAFVNSVLGVGANAPNTNGTIVTTDNNATVTNNITTTAVSGTAAATDNSHTGSVGSGQANTNVTILNLTSNQTVGKNALLVFVNVLGNWVGLILDAPAGTTSASLGSSGLVQNSTGNPDVLNSENNYQITNAITTTAQSGNAGATENTTVGNVHSGDTSASVNLLNILNSQISLSDWFGVLFINVFGTWNGNFGVQTATITPPNNGGSGGSSNSGGNGENSQPAFRFVPASQRNYTSRTFSSYATPASFSSTDSQYAPIATESISQPAVLGAVNSSDRSDRISLQTGKDKIEEQGLRWWLLPLVALLALFLAIRYYIARRRIGLAE